VEQDRDPVPDDREPNGLAALTDLVSSLRDEVRALRTEVDTLRRSMPQPATPPVSPPVKRDRPLQPPSGSLGANTYEIVFDGGSLGNPGRGYGSYVLFGPDAVVEKKKLDYAGHGNAVTSNQAEYLTLINALESLSGHLGPDARLATVSIWGDSHLVVNQIKGSWKVKNTELAPLVERALSALSRFKAWTIHWHDRSNSVRYLGH
jgi:ribonuclease HI